MTRAPEEQELIRARMNMVEHQVRTRGVLDARVLDAPAEAPYDAIVVAAGSPRVPAPLLDQLADRGRLVIPVGEPTDQRLLCVRNQNRVIETQPLAWCEFVPLVGRAGWASRLLSRSTA